MICHVWLNYVDHVFGYGDVYVICDKTMLIMLFRKFCYIGYMWHERLDDKWVCGYLLIHIFMWKTIEVQKIWWKRLWCDLYIIEY